MIPFEDMVSLFSCDMRNRDTIRMDLDEAAYLYKLIKGMDRPRCVEIGRLFGGSTMLMLAAGADVLSIDDLSAKSIKGSVEYDKVLEDWATRKGLSDRLTIVQGDSRSYDNKDNEYDLIFIDGDHRYEGVKADFEHWIPSLRIGGHILFHDSCVTRPMCSTKTDVVRFVGEVVRQSGMNLVKEIGSTSHIVKVGL